PCEIGRITRIKGDVLQLVVVIFRLIDHGTGALVKKPLLGKLQAERGVPLFLFEGQPQTTTWVVPQDFNRRFSEANTLVPTQYVSGAAKKLSLLYDVSQNG